MKPTILLIEDTPSLARLYCEYLRHEPVRLVEAQTGQEGLARIVSDVPAVVLLDLQLPDLNGLDILKYVKEQQIPSSVVVITAHGSVGIAVEAMRGGAYDFIVKPFAADRLIVTVRNALERHRLTEIVTTMKEDFGRDRFCGFIGSSLAMQAVYRVIDSAAKSRATVFITGESGTGKEVCAEAIHQKSPRAKGPFFALNCGAIPHDLIESEIFGHVKGAFTGAIADRDGAATQAHNGTLFLDEICEMDLGLQTKLLRFLQTGTFQKVGGTKTETVDVRYICATNKEPWSEVQAGNFREDLFYRLHVIPCPMPPLRDREDDVLAIARAFLKQYAGEENKHFTGFDNAVEAALQTYSWPGNVRQLQNVIRNIVVLHDGEIVTAAMLPTPLAPLSHNYGWAGSSLNGQSVAAVTNIVSASLPTSEAAIKPLWLIEKDVIERAIRLCGGNVPKAAALLDISASTIYRKRLSWTEYGNAEIESGAA